MVKYQKNPNLSNKKLNTCVSELIDWAYKSRSKRGELPFNAGENTKPFIIGADTALSRNHPTDIHCYTSDLVEYLMVDTFTLSKYNNSEIIKFILEYITPILIRNQILSISFGSYAYSYDKLKHEYYLVGGAM